MRQYREWKVGDTCYWGKLKGKVVRIDDFMTHHPISCEFEMSETISFSTNGSYFSEYNDQSLSFLPNELCMPFEEASFLPPKYVVRAENETQVDVLRDYFSKLVKRDVGGNIGHHYHSPEFNYSGFTCCTSDRVEQDYTLISFSDWVKMLPVDTSLPAEDKVVSDPLSSIPKPIIKRMLHYQVKQGNPENLDRFRFSIVSSKDKGGFDWGDTKEGRSLWSKALIYEDYKPLLKKINKAKKIKKLKKDILKMLKCS